MGKTQNRNCRRTKIAATWPLWGWGEVFLDLNSLGAKKESRVLGGGGDGNVGKS